MKSKKILNGVLIFLLSFMLIGCGESKKTDVKPESGNEIVSNNGENTKIDKGSTDSDEKNTSNVKNGYEGNGEGNVQNKDEDKSNEMFFGKWTISKDLTTATQITTYSTKQINSMMGKTVNFSKENATAFGESESDLNNIIENPVYKKTIVTKQEFEDSWKIKFKDLGIDKDSITVVDVSSPQSKNTCEFLIKDDNTLILYGGGILLELKK